MALVPPLAVVGDSLVHIRGGYMPGVLRRKERGERVAEWIGSSYVHLVAVVRALDWEEWLLE